MFDYNEEMDEYNLPQDKADYYFAAVKTEDPWGTDKLVTVVYLAPAAYFNKTSYLWDTYMPAVEDDLPAGFSQAMEATYTYEGTVEEADQAMLDYGLTFNEDFQAWVEDMEAEKASY